MDNISFKQRIVAVAISTAVLINGLNYAYLQNLTGEGLSYLPLTDELNFEDNSYERLNGKGKSRKRIPEGYKKTSGYLKTTYNG